MPRIVPIIPPSEEDKVKAALDKLHAAATALNISLDLDGFVRSWLSDSTRVVVAYEGETPVGFAIMSFGRRYFDANMTASVLLAEGPARPALLEYLVEMARMLGAQTLFYEAQEGDTIGGDAADMRVVKVI